MTPEKVIELAKQAGFKQRHNSPIEWWMVTDDIQAFAQLVRNAVIEECARDVEDWGVEVERDNVAASIRSLKS